MKSIPFTENEINHLRETYSLELEKLQKRAFEISTILNKLQGKEGDDEQPKDKPSQSAQGKALVIPAKNVSTKNEIAKKGESLSPKIEEKPKGKRGRPAKIKPEPKELTITTEIKPAIVKAKRGRKPSVKEVIETKPRNIKETTVSGNNKKLEKNTKAEKAVKVEKKEKPLKGASKAATKVEKIGAPAKRGRKMSDSSKKSNWTTLILEILKNKKKVLPSRDIIEQVMKMQNIPASDLRKTRSIITGSLSDLKLETKKVKSISLPGQKGEFYGLTQWFNELGQLLDPSKL